MQSQGGAPLWLGTVAPRITHAVHVEAIPYSGSMPGPLEYCRKGLPLLLRSRGHGLSARTRRHDLVDEVCRIALALNYLIDLGLFLTRTQPAADWQDGKRPVAVVGICRNVLRGSFLGQRAGLSP